MGAGAWKYVKKTGLFWTSESAVTDRPGDGSACIITGSGCCCFVMSLVVWFQMVSGIVLFFASQC